MDADEWPKIENTYSDDIRTSIEDELCEMQN